MTKPDDKPVTRNELNEIFDERFEEQENKLKKFVKEQIHTLDEKLDKIIGMFRKFDDEQTLQAGKLSDHEDRLEVVEGKLGILPQ